MNNAQFSMKMPNRVILDSNILPQAKGMKSTFDLSEGLKTSINFDYLYPVYWEELSPGDHFEVDVASVCRMMPTVAPVMDNVKLKFFAFWVPNRLLWKHFLNFMGERLWQDDTTDYLVPQINMKTKDNKVCGLADYLGCPPTGDKCDYSVSALPFRAYDKIWNDWFRAQEIQQPKKEFTGDNLPNDKEEDKDTLGNYYIHRKGKPMDYFTSCLPYPQSGEEVLIPLTGDAPVTVKTEPSQFSNLTPSVVSEKTGKSYPLTQLPEIQFIGLSGDSVQQNTELRKMYADMSHVTGVSIEALRKASALQVLLERDARAGERYPELVKMHYNVTCPDFLLGRSQFLGSCTSDVVINPVIQNSSTNDVSPQGHLTGIGVGQQNSNLCEVSAVEHGIFMIMCCASADVTYQQGVARKFNKSSRWDYMNPAFWNLGDQAVYNKEIFISPDKATNEAVFGYQERYRELREGINKITGKLRSGVEGSLDVWHLAEKFETLPKLNDAFIPSETPVERVMSAPDEEEIILDIWFDIKATRPLPVTSNPSLLAGRI